MAERRMFAKTIIDSDAFLDMPQSSQLLYFHLCMRADDEGFINNPKSIMRNVGAKEDDLKLLFAKKFVIPFESGVVVIKHWKIHNYIRNDRMHQTKYIEEKSQLGTDEKGSYTLCQSSDCQLVDKLDTEVRLGKVRLGKDNNIPTIPDELKEDFDAYRQMRKMLKKPMTDYAVRLALGKLKSLSPDINIQKQILRQSVEHSWLGLFPLKNFKQEEKLPVYDSSKNRQYSDEYIKELLELRDK